MDGIWLGNKWEGENSVPVYPVPPSAQKVAKGAVEGTKIESILLTNDKSRIYNDYCFSNSDGNYPIRIIIDSSDNKNLTINGIHSNIYKEKFNIRENNTEIPIDYRYKLELKTAGKFDIGFNNKALIDFLKTNLIINKIDDKGSVITLDNSLIVSTSTAILDKNLIQITINDDNKMMPLTLKNVDLVKIPELDDFEYTINESKKSITMLNLKQDKESLWMNEEYTINDKVYTTEWSSFNFNKNSTKTLNFVRLPSNSFNFQIDSAFMDTEATVVLTSPLHWNCGLGYATRIIHSFESLNNLTTQKNLNTVVVSPNSYLNQDEINLFTVDNNVGIERSYGDFILDLTHFSDYDNVRTKHMTINVNGRLKMFDNSNGIAGAIKALPHNAQSKMNLTLNFFGYSYEDFSSIRMAQGIDNLKSYPDVQINFYPELIKYPLLGEDWLYTIDDSKNEIQLSKYIGTSTDVIIHSNYEILGKVYRNVSITKGAVPLPEIPVEEMTDEERQEYEYSSNPFSLLNSTGKTLKIEKKVKAPVDSSNLFSNSKQQILDLSGFDTSNVTDMYSMFAYSQATELDVSNFNTSNVTRMLMMFWGSYAKNLDVSSFDTSNVTSMSQMFNNLKATRIIGLSNFNTNKVTDMSNMFAGCFMTELDVSNFDTSNVINMKSMFSNTKITEIDLSNFNTNKVTDMSGLFSSSTIKTILGIENLNTSNVTNMYSMFSICNNLTSLNLINFNTSKVTSMEQMFRDSKIPILDLSSFDTTNVTNMNLMFRIALTTTGYARTQSDADKFNASSEKPSTLTFVVKPTFKTMSLEETLDNEIKPVAKSSRKKKLTD